MRYLNKAGFIGMVMCLMFFASCVGNPSNTNNKFGADGVRIVSGGWMPGTPISLQPGQDKAISTLEFEGPWTVGVTGGGIGSVF